MLKALVKLITFFFIVEIFVVRHIFLLFLLNNVDIYYRKVIVITLFLFFMALKTFLVVWVFFARLALVDQRLLRLFFTRYVSKKNVSGLILSKILFFYKSILLETLNINFADI